jgi:hypothetical protein
VTGGESHVEGGGGLQVAVQVVHAGTPLPADAPGGSDGIGAEHSGSGGIGRIAGGLAVIGVLVFSSANVMRR